MSRPALTRRSVLNRAWPLVFANATVPLAAVIDTFVLGLSGDKADLGGVALGGAIFSVFYWSFYFLRMGTTGLTAQADGAGEIAKSQRILVRAMIVAGILGILILLLRHPISLGGFAILQGETDAEAKGASYLLARAWGSPAALAAFALTGWLIGLGRNSATLAIYAIFSAVNIGLDLWFGLWPGRRWCRDSHRRVGRFDRGNRIWLARLEKAGWLGYRGFGSRETTRPGRYV
jgi:MATE family multidrug resistance protein